MTQPDPKIGTIVHFGEPVWNHDRQEPVIARRAALVTSVGPIADNGIINLLVFTDDQDFKVIGVHHSAELKANCWSLVPRD